MPISMPPSEFPNRRELPNRQQLNHECLHFILILSDLLEQLRILRLDVVGTLLSDHVHIVLDTTILKIVSTYVPHCPQKPCLTQGRKLTGMTGKTLASITLSPVVP